MSDYDRVYFWQGGSEVGAWNEAAIPSGLNRAGAQAFREEIERMGYVAHIGSSKIGAPEGAPSKSDFRRVLGR